MGDGEAPGTLRLKSNEFSDDYDPIMSDCNCAACDKTKGGYSRARLHELLKSNNPLAAQLMTHHNIAYMMKLTRRMRTAIMENRYGNFAIDFVKDQYRGKAKGGKDVPKWVIDALN